MHAPEGSALHLNSCSIDDWSDDEYDQHVVKGFHDQVIIGVSSAHSDGAGDRIWKVKSCPLLGGGGFVLYHVSDWQNNWKGLLNYVSEENAFIMKIESEHNNREEDRRFKFHVAYHAKASFAKVRVPTAEAPVVTPLYGTWDFQCPEQEVLVGMSSEFSQHHRDRSFSFRCSRPKGVQYDLASCSMSDWSDSEYDQHIIKGVDNQVIVAVSSTHKDGAEDRLWKVKSCPLLGAGIVYSNTVTDWQNDWKQKLMYDAETDFFITKIES